MANTESITRTSVPLALPVTQEPAYVPALANRLVMAYAWIITRTTTTVEVVEIKYVHVTSAVSQLLISHN